MLDIFDNTVNLYKLKHPSFNPKKKIQIINDRSPHKILPFLDDDNISINNKDLIIKKSKIKSAGLGVYSLRDFKVEDIVEICPIIRVPDYSFTKDNILTDYIFKDPLNEDYKLIALGNGSIYNHADVPNLKYYYHNEKMIFQATKKILIGDELYISYGYGWWSSRDKLKFN